MIKPGQPISSLDAEQLGVLASHPAQLRNLARIEELLEDLDTLETPEQYLSFQAELYREVFETFERLGRCRQSVKRLSKGRPPKIDVAPPTDVGLGDGTDAWRFEALLYERLARQLRTVGDGLAWRTFNYNRSLIVAMSRNDSPGPLERTEGLEFELRAVRDIWQKKRSFALLHDLTNCLRIADLTEVGADGHARLHEVKRGRPAGSRQTRRMKAVVEAVLRGGRLPGETGDARLVQLETIFRTDLDGLGSLLQLATQYGGREMKLPPGRAVVATDLLALLERHGSGTDAGIRAVENARARALRLAGLDTANHLVRANSGDTAARSPLMVPFAIYPFPARLRSKLICDFMLFETHLDPDVLVSACDRAGLRARIELPPRHGDLNGSQPVMTVFGHDTQLTLRAQGLAPLLYELVHPDCWASGIRELLALSDPPEQPMVVYRGERESWVPVR